MVSLTWVPTQVTQSVIPIGGALFIVAQLLSLPEVLRQARGAGIVDHELDAGALRSQEAPTHDRRADVPRPGRR